MKTTIKILATTVLTLSAGVFVISVMFRLSGIYINTTPSFPLGLYKVVNQPVTKGAYVSFCPPQGKVFELAVARRYINSGDCPGGYGKLLKRVFAQAGDSVLIDEAGIQVNGQLLLNSGQLVLDADGQPLPQFRFKWQRLDAGEYLLLSDINPQSFDARYFGLIRRAQIKHVVEPFLTWRS
jgi:conjugative transfer signal peptidase TraF